MFRVAPKSMKWGKDLARSRLARKKTVPGSGVGTVGQRISGDTTFDGNRWNDLHYMRSYKKAARQRAARGKA